MIRVHCYKTLQRLSSWVIYSLDTEAKWGVWGTDFHCVLLSGIRSGREVQRHWHLIPFIGRVIYLMEQYVSIL